MLLHHADIMATFYCFNICIKIIQLKMHIFHGIFLFLVKLMS